MYQQRLPRRELCRARIGFIFMWTTTVLSDAILCLACLCVLTIVAGIAIQGWRRPCPIGSHPLDEATRFMPPRFGKWTWE